MLAVLSCTYFYSGRHYVAEPPPGLPLGWLLAAVVSRVLGSPVTLPLHPYFDSVPEAIPALQPVLLPGASDWTSNWRVG